MRRIRATNLLTEGEKAELIMLAREGAVEELSALIVLDAVEELELATLRNWHALAYGGS